MPGNLDNSSNVFETYPVKGESISLWVPLCLGLLGIIVSVLISQSLLSAHIKMDSLLSWPSTTGGSQHDQETKKSIDKNTTELLEGKVENGKFVEVNQKKIIPSVINEGSKSSPVESDKIELKKTKDCPPLFFFTFSKSSEIPKTHNLMPKIKRLSDWLQQHPNKKVFIDGHTDSFGTEEYNLLLSYRRAKAAEKILVAAGISKDQVIARALGEQESLQGHSAQSKENRRASIRIEALKECINSLINEELN